MIAAIKGLGADLAPRSTVRAVVLTLASALVPMAPAAWASQEQLQVVLPFDAIQTIDRPRFEPVATAKPMSREELVIGLVGAREQRAYSTWQLDRHEIVNDVLEGRPIAVTW